MDSPEPSLDYCPCCCCTRHANTLRWRCCGRRCNIGPHWPCNAFAWLLIVAITLAFLLLVAVKLHWGVVVADVCTCLALFAAFGATSFLDPGYLERQTAAQLAAQMAGRQEDAAARLGASLVLSDAVEPAGTGAAVDAAVRAGGSGSGGGGGAGPPWPPRASLPGAHNPLLAVTTCSICNVLRERGTTHCQDCGLCVKDLDHHCPWSGSASFAPPPATKRALRPPPLPAAPTHTSPPSPQSA